MKNSAASVLFCLLLCACLESATKGTKGGGKRSAELGTSVQAARDFRANHFRQGGQHSSTTFSLNFATRDTLTLGGSEVHTHISNGNSETVACLVAHFPRSPNKKVLLLALRPQRRDGSWTYLINPADQEGNVSFCNTPGMNTHLESSLSVASDSMTFSLSELCPNCLRATLDSQALFVATRHGRTVSDIAIGHMTLRLFAGERPPAQLGCQGSSQCRMRGLDCCSQGQCVRDRQVRDTVDTQSEEFLQARRDIVDNPERITDYPNFFHICPSSIQSPLEVEEPISDSEEQTRQRLTELQELYQCLNPQEGEMALCTHTIANASPGGTYQTPTDDRNFSTVHTSGDTSSALPPVSVEQVTYGGEVLYGDRQIRIAGSLRFGPGNDNLVDGQQVFLSHTRQADSANGDLKIRYKIDGSCVRSNNRFAKCHKIYVQGQNLSRVDDHYPASNTFLLPLYADLGRTIGVKVNDSIKVQGRDWELIAGLQGSIRFTGESLQVNDGQTVTIDFFVNLQDHPVMQKKQAVLGRVQQLCQCQGNRCNLKPRRENNQVIDYDCVYPRRAAPLQQTVYLSAKSVPHLYYDNSGTYHSSFDSDTPAQEGLPFKYVGGNLARPNNMDAPVGFNEIYGSFDGSKNAALPAKEVKVDKGKIYNIFVDEGLFSTCRTCGNDYYSTVTKLFPDNFLHKGGGYEPNGTTTKRFSHNSPYRADDLLFGRACWLPATMIPWSHASNSDLQNQRQNRLRTQHFLFANGYQRDWYGFDYGALIGSFDGVSWFAIGNQRQIKAKSDKLFLAINAYFGDLTQQSSFKVFITESLGGTRVSQDMTKDFYNEGAQCRKFHVCKTDRDCITQLGYDYSCQKVSNITSTWPVFDDDSQEVLASEKRARLFQLFDVQGAGSYRCVYRGRGAPCRADYDLADQEDSYNESTLPGHHACSHNTYCQQIFDGIYQEAFNDKISRFARPALALVEDGGLDLSDLDTFGLGTKVIGRPDQWRANKRIIPEVTDNLDNNRIRALCLPGKDVSPSRSLRQQNSAQPGPYQQGDQVLGMGMTPRGQSASHYLNSCPVIRPDTGQFYRLAEHRATDSLTDSELAALAKTQAIPTNALLKLQELIGNRVIADFDIPRIESPTLQENRCLRAPGASCFTDFDCAPSRFIAQEAQTLDATDSTLWGELNRHEIEFWQQGLVCAQAKNPTDEDFSLNDNRCCREVGKNLTIATLVDQSKHAGLDAGIPVFNNTAIPGVDIDLDNPGRYGRNSTAYDLVSAPNNNYPPLQSARADSCGELPGCFDRSDFVWDKQYNTFSAIAQRTCCNGHWVRNFHRQDNGGGHVWNQRKMQTINKGSFKCLNWLQCNGASCGNNNFTCDHTEAPDDPQCLARTIRWSEANQTLKFIETLELLGIPQIKVKGAHWPESQCEVNPRDQSLSGRGTPGITLPDIFQSSAVAEYEDSSGNELFSAADRDNFHDDLRQVFSPDEITCCLPGGTQMKEGDNPNLCCTGFINPESKRCQLEDYANVSVYFNRYVSSHAKELSESLIDDTTGYIANPGHVEQLACETNICASQTLARGVALFNLKIPGHEDSSVNVRRWVDSNHPSNQGIDKLHDAGLRWNNHVYCVPPGIQLDTTISCAGE